MKENGELPKKDGRGGAGRGQGRKKNRSEQSNEPEQPTLSSLPNKNLATEILASLGVPDWKCAKCKDGNCELCLWRMHAIRDRSALEYLWNRRDGKPVHIVNHLHDKPIEHTVTVTIAEVVRKVRERKEAYERSR